ncbi:MAG: LytR C-terminal domain-containing protein [Candidatus Shapirobacteria bacterium]|jgi:hypothetical protein
MGLFSKPKAVLLPKAKTADLFLDRKDNNTLSFDFSLWQAATDNDLKSLSSYLAQNHVDSLEVLLPDDVVVTRSFIYDSSIQQIDPKELVSLTEGFVNFKITPDNITYNLVQLQDKTLIQTRIYNQAKIEAITSNLSRVNIKVSGLIPISASIAKVISAIYDQDYFIIYPNTGNSYWLILAKNDSVYLATTVKGPALEIQKTINYSNLYFASPTKKIFYPQNFALEISSSTTLDKTEFLDSQIASKFSQPSNFPLPVLGVFLSRTNVSKADIIKSTSGYNTSKKTETMDNHENKKNVLPLVAVFIFTAALASLAIWYFMNRNTLPDSNTIADITPTVFISLPTETPSPTPVPISKDLKIQVLNATSINGQAATLKKTLSDLGFTNITLGNSSEKLTQNEIRMKSSLSDFSGYFSQSMSDFPANITATLKDSATYDLVFVIGTDLSKAGSPTETDELESTPTPKASPSKSAVTPTESAANPTE